MGLDYLPQTSYKIVVYVERLLILVHVFNAFCRDASVIHCEYYENCLENCKRSCDVNNVSSNVNFIPLTWGLVNEELINLEKVDYIIGSDCFYDKKDFEDIMFTVAYLMEENHEAVFLTSYQLRSTKYRNDLCVLNYSDGDLRLNFPEYNHELFQ